MCFDPLPSGEDTEEVAQFAREYALNPAALYASLNADVCASVQQMAVADEQLLQATQQVRAGAQACRTALLDATDALPVSKTFFRERVDASHFARLCRAIADLEAGHRAIQRALLFCAQAGAALRECHVSACSVARRVYVAKRVAHGRADEAEYATLANRLRDVSAQCEDTARTLNALRERTGAFCFDTVPRFLNVLRARADLDGDGAACDGSAVRALCAELQQALKPFL